jgi:hypothetical protein
MFRFWRRIFAVGFAIGVVAGIVITFQMGLDWRIYAAMTGPIIGPIAMEVVTVYAMHELPAQTHSLGPIVRRLSLEDTATSLGG